MIIAKFTKNRYIQKLTIGYYCQKINECAKKYQTTDTFGAQLCRI